MSHISTTALTTTTLVTVVSSGLSSVTVAPSLTGFPVSLDQHGVVLPPPLMPRGSGGVIGHASVPQQQTTSSMPLLAYANYVMGSPQVGFFSQSWASHHFVSYMFGVHSGVCFLLLGAKLDAIFTYGGSTIRGLHLCNPLEFTHGRHMCNLVMVIGPHLVCIEWLLPLLPWVGGAFCYSFSCAPTIWWGIQPWGLCRESPDPSAFPTWWGGVFFSRFGAIRWCSRFWFCYGC